MKKNKRIALILLVIVLTLSIGLVVFAESNTSVQDKENTGFLKRIVSTRYWNKGLGFLQKSVDDGIINDETSAKIKEYYKDKTQNKVPLMQELLDKGFITSEQKQNIDAYLEEKKAAMLNPLDELVEEGLITEEQKTLMMEQKNQIVKGLIHKFTGRIFEYFVNTEVVTREEADAIYTFMKDNRELFVGKDKDILAVLLENELLTQAQVDKIKEIENENITRTKFIGRQIVKRFKMGGVHR